jgi:hypothetical protein
VFAVESEPVAGYTETRQESLSADVLCVETDVVRSRVLGPGRSRRALRLAPGHGFRVGDLVEAKPEYNGHGKAAQTFNPSEQTRETYQVRPGTPYDLVLPYRIAEVGCRPRVGEHDQAGRRWAA